ncbi:MAG: serine hydrolase domain-containing protein [Propionibacteriaceae bacterium]
MSTLHDILAGHVDAGLAPGAVALVAHPDGLEVEVVGSTDVDGSSAMTRDSIFRIASITKPITAAAGLVLVDDGEIALTDPIERWLPELSSPKVVRTPSSPVDDVVPLSRPITVRDLLEFRAGCGFGSDFSLPATLALFGLQPGYLPLLEPDAWLAALAAVPLLHQPGEAWLYNTCSDVLGVLISRVSGHTFPDFLAERLFEPLGMADTAFEVPAAKLDRFTTAYRPGAEGLELVDLPTGQFTRTPAFPSGAAGLVSTVDDWYAFGRFLLAEGSVQGRQLLSAPLVRQLMTDQLTGPQRGASELFLEGQGWGFGGSVDVVERDPWNVPGRYGWIGGTGTAAHVSPRTGTVSVLFTQRELTGPSSTPLMQAFWTHAASVPVRG